MRAWRVWLPIGVVAGGLCCTPAPPPASPLAGVVTGTARGTDGLPVAGVGVIPLGHDTLLGVTDSLGQYRLHLPPGRHALEFHLAGVPQRQDTIQAAAGVVLTHNVQLATTAPGLLTVRVRDAHGRPLARGWVLAVIDAETRLWRSDREGVVQLVVRPGWVRVDAWRTGQRHRVDSVQVASRGREALDFALP